MATKIKDQATAQLAALKLNEGIEVPANGEPNTPREKTTSERLFPAFTTDDGAIVNRPVRNLTDTNTPVPVTETPQADLQGQTPPTQTPTAPVYLSDTELKGKMVKLKVDGIEQDVPAEQLLKLNQLERHSNTQLMKLAQEKAEFERERAAFIAQRSQPQQDTQKQTRQEPVVKKNAEVEALEARLAQMEGFIAQQQETLRPAIQESGIKRVEQLAKERLGTDDFRSYFDKVRDIAVSKAQEAQLRGDPNWKQFDTDGFYFETYKEMKIKDLITKPPAPMTNSNSPVLTTQQGAPVIMNSSGQPVSLPSFESSSGVPSRQNPDANWQGTYNALFSRAQKSGSEADWAALYRHKMQRE
jgi:hypothetical protein